MSEHHASVIVHAPIHQVYNFFTHFNDFPKFMSFVKEVTYYDDQRSHWVAQIAGKQEWDAVNENWIPDQQIGWRSTKGLQNRGLIRFTPIASDQTRIDVYITYDPPAGFVGEAVDRLGFDSRFDEMLQHDLENFARMVEKTPQGALDPMQSNYLFHQDSAVAKNNVTPQQKEAMRNDPMMSEQALQERESYLQQERNRAQQQSQQQEESRQQRLAQEQQVAQQQSEALRRQAEIDRQTMAEQEEQNAVSNRARQLDPVQDTIGGRNASMERLAIGDQDARTERFPGHHEDPMMARKPNQRDEQNMDTESAANMEVESPWRTNIIGTPPESETPEENDSEDT